MEPRVSLITLGVSDLARAVRFYRDGLGWAMSSVGGDGIAFFQLGGGLAFALWPRHLLVEDSRIGSDPGGFGGIALAYNVPERDEVDRVLAFVVKHGATILRPAEDAFWGGRSGYFADPDGHPWEVAWNPGFPMGPDGAVKVPT
ncbi:MAG: VOC family protein [Chloroflexota bacterium]|nr:MAG: VOC family protein [Chloroflexota bacterium]